jgi:hypothetical protein
VRRLKVLAQGSELPQYAGSIETLPLTMVAKGHAYSLTQGAAHCLMNSRI